MPADTDFGNPAPLGLAGFGMTTVLLSTFNAGLLTEGEAVVFPLAIAFGGLIQFFAGLTEWSNGNTFGMVAFSSYGAFWWWFALMELFALNGIISLEGATAAIGWTLILWGIFTLYMWVGTFRLNWGLFGVFLVLWITFFLLGFGDLLGIETLAVWGGYVGILDGFIALYVSFAEVTNWSFDRTVIPLGDAPLSESEGDQPAEPAD